MIKSLNLGLRFILELYLLGALGYAGFNITNNALLKWILLLILPTIAAVIWGVFIAPKASHHLAQPQRLFIELILFGSAAVLLAIVGQKFTAALLAAIASINEAFLWLWKQ